MRHEPRKTSVFGSSTALVYLLGLGTHDILKFQDLHLAFGCLLSKLVLSLQLSVEAVVR